MLFMYSPCVHQYTDWFAKHEVQLATLFVNDPEITTVNVFCTGNNRNHDANESISVGLRYSDVSHSWRKKFKASAAVCLRSSAFWDDMHLILVVVCRRFGTTYPSYLLRPVSPRKNEWILKTGRTGCPEMSVINYRHKLHNIPQEQGHSWACWSETNLQQKHLRLKIYFWIII